MTTQAVETAPEGPVLEHRAGAVSGSESSVTNGSGSTVPPVVQTVYDFGGPQSHGAIRCVPWCTDGNGHTKELMRSEQACWSASNAVVLGLAEGAPALPISVQDWAALDPAHIAVAAYKAWHGLPVVDLHLYHPSRNPSRYVDFNTKLTADEAEQLAHFLLAAVETIRSGGAHA